MARPGLATRDDLLRWPSIVAAGEFPRLIRRLILETVPDAVRLGFPAGSGTSAGSWDGSVRAVAGNTFVPAGLSVWELSVGQSGIAAKADGDYEKRTSTPDGSPVSDAVYIEAMLRPWPDRRTWAAGKRGDRRWKDVIGYGVDDIEEWLESAPVTHSWVSEMLNLAPHGYRAVETWWRGWAGATTPVLPTGAVLAGRDRAVQALEDRLEGTPSITTIRGVSLDEVLAFIAAVLERQASAGDSRWLSRAAFVDQVTSWRALAERPGPLILVPTTADVAAEAARGAAHHVLIPVTAAADIDLPPIDSRTAAVALRAEGLGEGSAEQAGRLARTSLLAMRRSLASRPELHTPSWASGPSRTLRGLLLAGRWSQTHDTDRAAISDLTGEDYDTLRETVAGLNRASDPFVTQIGSIWMLTNMHDAWIHLCETVRQDDLDRLEPVLRRALLERDPALDLSPDDRWSAGAVGKSPTHSADLRRGLATTLAALGVHGQVIDTGHGTNGAQWAARFVGDLLREANADTTGDTWNSLAGLLPLLAEAAPDAFLDGLRNASQGAVPVISTMFTDSTTTSVTRELSRHHHLLWALETLAWSPDHFGRVVLQLARLAEIDPGGSLSSRPFNSLVTVLCLEYPETTVPVAGRMAVIERLRDRHPDVAWRLMLTLLPSQFDLHGPTPNPEFRDWKPQEPVAVTADEWLDCVRTLVNWLILDAGDNVRRWQQVLDVFPFLPKSDRQRLREAMATRVGDGTLSDDGRADLWESLRELITHHRSRAGKPGSLPVDEVDALQDIERALAPSDPVQRHRWLFATQMPELAEHRRFGDPAYDSAVQDKRIAAITEIEERGIDAVREVAATAADARTVGVCLAEVAGDKYRSELVAMIPADPAGTALIEGWLSRQFQKDGWTWLDGLLAEELTPEQAAVALLASRDYPKAWEVAEAHGTPVAEAFWKYFSINGLGRDFGHVGEAASQLAQAGRVAAALKLVVIYLDDLGDTSADLLIRLLGQFADTYQSDPETGLVGEYDFRALFEYLHLHTDPQRSTEIGQLEWVFLSGLGFQPPAGRLREALAAEPELFVQIMSSTWRATDAQENDEDSQGEGAEPEDETLTKEQVQQATNGYALLTSIDRLPGIGPDGRVDPAALQQWVARVLELATASGRRRIAEMLVGQMLASAPADDDGTWPCQPVRDLLEELQSERVERSLAAQLYNDRGMTSRDPEDGGRQERALAERYLAQATTFSDSWPQTAVVLRRVASMYETDAHEHDDRAERFRQGQQT
ncbi:XRE family transcriptional regulator [Catenulispora acidiphila DSM 44928]|uniref:XRE family transcriptional regulator n=1 Tax=Catenulispora acidiphila (strain DSM 44928 / JCM 14897 / NBRC 102108 / NRRL B-24433 / ID139908) TaxID=479433 RepID=C7QG71_CATAD|nr:hypothetical protein [Catenulispora acidiphila]ACU72916.1 XRE family transcriptional regulator [Catenulispora acidiphila DSM 44928]